MIMDYILEESLYSENPGPLVLENFSLFVDVFCCSFIISLFLESLLLGIGYPGLHSLVFHLFFFSFCYAF